MSRDQPMHMNELIYAAYKDMAGVLWSMVVVLLFLLPFDMPYRKLILFVVGLVALLPLLWIVHKKMRLAGKAIGALKRGYETIYIDFGWKYIAFGIGMFLVRFAIEPNLLLDPSMEMEFNTIFFVTHVFLAIVLLGLMRTHASRERKVL